MWLVTVIRELVMEEEDSRGSQVDVVGCPGGRLRWVGSGPG